MVEVSDFQCPFCSRFHTESYSHLHKEYIATGRVKLAYVNFPLPMHANAFPAAEASMCAGAQGRFWQMHDALFRTQEAWSEKSTTTAMFDTLAVSAGVKLPAFQQCMRDHVMRSLVQQDLDRGKESGVRSTPTFFIGDTAILGAQPVEVFRRVLDTAIARAARGRGSP
jgi:protein-disulfide isomerase